MPEFQGPKIVMIGGGTGSFTLLKGLKNYATDITALVNMADDGGSTGQLRDEYGVLPPGDIRQCLVALSESSEQMRELFNYRFGEGSFDGHSFGNLFLIAVEKMTDDFGEAVKLASKVLNVKGKVLPITLDNTHLVMLDAGKITKGEHKIGNLPFMGKTRPIFKLEPSAQITKEAKEAILNADMIIIAPGNFYGSLVPSVIVDGVSEALKQTSAKVVQVINLVTKPGQTDGWGVSDYVTELESYTGGGVIDYALYNTEIPKDIILKRYAKEGEFPVVFREGDFKNTSYKAIGKNLVSKEIALSNQNDRLKRTLIRHDSDVVARHLMRIYFS